MPRFKIVDDKRIQLTEAEEATRNEEEKQAAIDAKARSDADTAAVNRANELNANAVLDISKTAYDNLWQNYKDVMEFAWKSAESQLDRLNN